MLVAYMTTPSLTFFALKCLTQWTFCSSSSLCPVFFNAFCTCAHAFIVWFQIFVPYLPCCVWGPSTCSHLPFYALLYIHVMFLSGFCNHILTFICGVEFQSLSSLLYFCTCSRHFFTSAYCFFDYTYMYKETYTFKMASVN